MLRKLFNVILFFVLLVSSGYSFGKNKVQYRGYEWYYIQSEHFDIYYYDNTYKLATFTATVAESAYVDISKDFNYDLQNRLSIILYKSHNHFQQTNVILQYMEEGIGGVTELFKNRIVVPFEGDYEQFRHVIHHELVHGVMNDMLYGGSIQSLIAGKATQVPLWLSEGIAEFESQGWNHELDMAVRDAVVNNYMPPLNYLSYYLPYQGGASVFWFIAETYGREKISELFHRLRGTVQFERVIQRTFGMKMDDFSKKWHRWLKKMYWRDYSDRIIPSEFADVAVDHLKLQNYLNVSPALSPDGSHIAFISNKDGYQSLYLYSTIKNKIVKKLIKGTRSESFEELHLLRPGISFSPNSKKIAFTAKSKGHDWIYIKEIKNGDMDKIKIDLDGIYTVSWSPDGKNIAFVGNHNETSDIYLLNIVTKKIKNITNDVFSDDMPSWSAEGDKIVFVSNRGNYIDNSQLPDNFNMTDYNYSQRDVYEFEFENNSITRITETEWNEEFPVYIEDDNNLLFTSYENGVSNIYHYNKITQQKRPLTNVVTGIFQLSLTRDYKKMAFVSFSYGGFDVFTVNNPLKLNVPEIEKTHFVSTYDDFKNDIKEFHENKKNKNIAKTGKNSQRKSDAIMKKDYDRYVFGPNLFGDKTRNDEKKKQKEDLLELPQNKIMTDDGEYYVRKYKINLSPDYVIAQAGYNTYFGVQGYTQFSFSDLLGNYQILLNTNLYYDLRNSDYAITLLNLKHRIDYGIGGFHYADYFYNNGLIRYRNYGVNLFGSYGFSRYRRIDFGMIWYNVALEYLDRQIENQAVSTIMPQVNYVYDNVLYGYTGPVAGTRYHVSMLMSPDYSSNSRDFRSITGDFRKYFMLNRNYQFAARLSGGLSVGENPQQYFVGGIDNWINRKFRGGKRIKNIDDVYFSSFVTPMRGAYYYERVGDKYFLTNLEFRFPLINILSLGFPPITLGNVRGVVFTDIGTAWYDNKLKLFERDENDNLKTKNLLAGYGVGARLYFLGFLMRFDVAWRYDIVRSHQPIFYFSLGGDI